jgi:hypothetical protein
MVLEVCPHTRAIFSKSVPDQSAFTWNGIGIQSSQHALIICNYVTLRCSRKEIIREENAFNVFCVQVYQVFSSREKVSALK